MSDVMEKVEVETVVEITPYEDTDDGDEHLTHIINPPSNVHIWVPGMSTQDVVDIARTNGMTVTALCGYTWVPKRNPEKYPVCQTCVEAAGEIMRGMGE